MEKRVLLAVGLSVAVLIGFNALFPPVKPPSPATAGAPGGSAAVPATGAPGTPAPTELERTGSPAALAPAAPAAPAAQTLVGDSAEHAIVVENDAVRATFSSRGGVLTSWRVKHYAENGAPLDLLPAAAPAGSQKPFTLLTDDQAVNASLAQALFKPSASSLDVTSAPATLTFEYRDASGLSARKVFKFSPEKPYEIDFTAEITHGGTALVPTIAWGPALGTGRVSSGMTYAPSPQPIYYLDRTEHRVSFSDIPTHQQIDGAVGFAGVDDHYFLTAVVAPAESVRIQYQPLEVKVEGAERPLNFVQWTVRPSSPAASLRFFAGPKDFNVLEKTDRELTRAIHFGYFGFLVVPLLRALKWVNNYIGNYGWSIIALTVIINLVMFPLRHKSVVSMRKMQEIQPEVKAIQDRYSKLKMNDPARQKMNVELMNLYRERGVNPASGCVPMLLTLPVLFAFYSMLSVAIELRGAPFVGWIKDLSTYDPWFVTPVLMGATQFVQQKMTPATGDPAQQRIMLFMPLIFMTMFIWAPSGLVLYWTVSNLWAIGQQVITNRMIGPAPQRAVRPPAERRLKNAGGGKSDAAKERK
jgi:YidC/Oxa1 family membrane protein insertase